MAESDDITLNALVDELADDPSYAWGMKPAPRRVTAGESLSVIRDVFSGCDAADEHMPGIAAAMGREIACSAACKGRCCEQLILVSLPEALAVAAELSRPERAADLPGIVSKLRTWRVLFGDHTQAAAKACAEGRDDDYKRMQTEHARKLTMCPFIQDRRCGVYDARPLKCREVWVVDTWKHCGVAKPGEEERDASLLKHPQVERHYGRAKNVALGLQSAAGMGHERQPLPLLVLALLEAEGAAPTDAGEPKPQAPTE